jgi:hypothetical protein
MIKIGPETLAQAESLDLTMTESDDLGFCLRVLSSKLWQYGSVLDLGVLASQRIRPEGKLREATRFDCIRIVSS